MARDQPPTGPADQRLVTPPLSRLVCAVALGGAVGAVLRHGLGQLVPDGSGFPVTTFAINVCGAFALALLPALAAVRRSRTLAVGLGPGVLGGFTTLSATSEQGRSLLERGNPALAGAYLIGTLGTAVLAALVAAHWSAPASRQAFADAEGDR